MGFFEVQNKILLSCIILINYRIIIIIIIIISDNIIM